MSSVLLSLLPALLQPALLGALSIIETPSWYFLPLVVAVSLVYGATRAEQWPDVWNEAVRFGAWLIGVLAVIFGVLLVLSLRL
ncbi:MAG: hypothetical protein ACKOBW_00225 [Planctomycetota bacterium]